MAELADPSFAARDAARPLSIGFIGSGRAATSLASSLARHGQVVAIEARGESAARLARGLDRAPVTRETLVASADVVVLAVPDGQLAGVVAGLAAVAVHLAGSLDREALAPLRDRGFAVAAVHPLQVLSGWRIPPGTTFAVDADPIALPVVARLVEDLGGVELTVPAAARHAYHAAAVLAANLGMALLGEAADLMQAAGIDRQPALVGLTGLVRGGLEAASDRGLPDALTGPVVRGDLATVSRHLEALHADPELEAAYRAVSLLLLRQVARTGRPDAAARAAMSRLLEGKA
jgi:predicted short-subunit dehydrogenase-like oxidoreductase (DUF2520 family)